MNKLISVIIPCYNSARYIATALDSMLSQTYKNLEIIIVDDNSSDDLLYSVESYLQRHSNIRFIKVPEDDPYRFNKKGVNINAGYAARNFGVENARGDIITFQDADDASLNNRIEIQYAVMEKYNAAHVVVDWQKFNEKYVGKALNIPVEEYMLIMPQEIMLKVKCNPPIPAWLRDPYSLRTSDVPIIVAAKRIGRYFLWKEREPYPCAANSVLVKREVFTKIKFRPLWERTRPSKKGRGADMDFNYAVAEVFKNSIAINLPLYLWRFVKEENNPKYLNKKFIPS